MEVFCHGRRLFHGPVGNHDLPIPGDFLISVRKKNQGTKKTPLDKCAVQFEIQRPNIQDIEILLFYEAGKFFRPDFPDFDFLPRLVDKHGIIKLPPFLYPAHKGIYLGVTSLDRNPCGSCGIGSPLAHTVQYEGRILIFGQIPGGFHINDGDIDGVGNMLGLKLYFGE